jgi:hypothetical protein
MEFVEQARHQARGVFETARRPSQVTPGLLAASTNVNGTVRQGGSRSGR